MTPAAWLEGKKLIHLTLSPEEYEFLESRLSDHGAIQAFGTKRMPTLTGLVREIVRDWIKKKSRQAGK